MKQAKPMKYYSRTDRQSDYVDVKPGVALMPREIFAGHDELLAAYDEMVTLNEAVRTHQRESGKKRAEADQASLKYKADVKAALSAGKDPSKIKNTEPQLRAEAEAHAKFADDALAQATKHGYQLGALMREHATDCFAPVEERMREAAAAIDGAVASLERAFADWAIAWQVRSRLSQVALRGGTQHGFNPNTSLPAGVAVALGQIREEVDQLDVLKADEQALTEWRANEVRAAGALARSLGGS